MMDFVAANAAVISLAILGVLFVAFALERYPPEVTAIAGAAAFVVLGFVDADQVMAVFSNSAPITIAAMFVISGALIRTGVLDALAGALIGRAQSHPSLAILGLLVATVAASAFVNNTPVVLVLIPVVIRLAASLELAPTKLLIPLSYAAILGGTCTLIGTSTNILVDGIAREAGLPAFSIFSIAPVGLAAVATGAVVMFVFGRFVLPDRGAAGDDMSETQYLSEIAILGDYAGIGQPLPELTAFQRTDMRITGVRRAGTIQRAGLDELILQKADALILMATTSELLTLSETEGLRAGLRRSIDIDPDAEIRVAEAIVTPTRGNQGQRIADLALGRREGVRVVGAARKGHIPGADLQSVRLRPADKLLLEGTDEGFAAMAASGDVLQIARPAGRAFRRRQAPVALLALLGIVVLAALDVMPIGILALLAVAAILVLRCIDADEAWSSIDGAILVLIFAMLVIGAGLEATGAVTLVVDALTPILADTPPLVTLAIVYFMASILTELVTNNAVAVVLTPVVIPLATTLGVEPVPFVVAVMVAASASFATPIGYQTNTLVYGAGDYRFSDFLKVGVPMNLLVGAAAIIAISIFFPL